MIDGVRNNVHPSRHDREWGSVLLILMDEPLEVIDRQ
jgi:hypothetical protein